MTGYENVLVRHPMKTSAKLRAAGGAKLQSKQRKWKVFLSIGLLLPALAAIIGIVAWAISVEVASGGQNALGGATHYRKPQQPEKLQRAAFQQQESSLYHQFRRQQQQPAERDADGTGSNVRLPVAAAVVGQRPAPARRRPEREEKPSMSRETKSESGKQASRANEITFGTNEEHQASSAILLTNLEQVEALSGSAATATPPPPTTTTDANQASSTADEPAGTGNNEPDNNKQSGEPAITNDDAHQPDFEQEDGSATGAKSAPMSRLSSPAKTRRPSAEPAKSENHKSRWSNTDKTNIIKKPIKVSGGANGSSKSDTDGRIKQVASGGHKRPLVERGSAVDSNRRRKQLAGRLSRQKISFVDGSQANNRYIIVDKVSDDTADSELDEQSSPAPSTESDQQPDGAESNESDEEDTGSGRSTSANTSRDRPEPKGDAPKAASYERLPADDELSFEAIASAISSAASNAQLAEERSAAPGGDRMPAEGGAGSLLGSSEQGAAPPLEGDTGLLQSEPASEEAGRPSGLIYPPASVQPAAKPDPSPASRPAQPIRRRTAGEHVAEVIDHIVERRKQAAGSRSPAGQQGPQIVVVAPVGGMKARSLTKAEPAAAPANKSSSGSNSSTPDSKAAIKKQPVVEDKRIVSSLKKEVSQSFGAKKDLLRKQSKPIGARLLGNPAELAKDSSSPSQIKYSERVEVIEDDDSSAFLMKNHPRGSQLAAELDRDDENERRRSDLDTSEPQHQALAPESPAMLLEAIGEQSSIHVSSQPSEPRSRSPRHEMVSHFERYARQFAEPTGHNQQPPQQQPQQQPKLYSAEQLIRDHVLKSKLRTSKQSGQQEPLGAETQKRPEAAGEQQQFMPSQQMKSPPTTVRPPHNGPSSASSTESNSTNRDKLVRQQQPSLASPRQERLLAPNREQPADIQQGYASSIQAVQVPMFMQQKQLTSAQSGPAKQADMYQAIESQQSSLQYQPAPSQQHIAADPGASSNQQQLNEQYQQMEQQQSSQSQQQPQIPQQSALPVFADQEYNVPAHMAESVIQDIQRSQPTIGMVNNQPTLVSLAEQVPYLQNQQQQQLQLQYQPSNQQSLYQLASQQQAWQSQAAAANLLARLANQQQQEYYLNQQQPQTQVLANRNGIETPSKSIRSAIVHPVAQLALRHLLNSIGQQQANAVAASKQSGANEPRARSMAAPLNSNNQVSNQAPTDAMQVAGSAPAISDALPSIGGPLLASPTPDNASTGRSMRSLPIGDKLAAGQASQDQETQESYGQMPAYHMPAGYGDSGGHHYDGDGYQSDHDKKSKGVTFHFGGGPIGGGTQLITSPMGIFKHLMIPLLPNPRVNLNGKVVFGVVLEKSTAIGEPKKKYKFWGR